MIPSCSIARMRSRSHQHGFFLLGEARGEAVGGKRLVTLISAARFTLGQVASMTHPGVSKPSFPPRRLVFASQPVHDVQDLPS